ncbi:hypothetical protein PEC302107_38200 [Pectobacterium araliae]|nr:hypothetical protein PEC302107_38200 [Pectobacterium carotovorum subsp. carotovorum]
MLALLHHQQAHKQIIISLPKNMKHNHKLTTTLL